MKNRNVSHHIWKAIETQAKTVSDGLDRAKNTRVEDCDIEAVNEFELKRLRILIRQLEEESPS